MELRQFINQYGKHIRSYKQYDNGVLRITFANKGEIMWLKGLVHEKLDMTVKTSNHSKTYWFQ